MLHHSGGGSCFLRAGRVGPPFDDDTGRIGRTRQLLVERWLALAALTSTRPLLQPAPLLPCPIDR